MTARIAGFVSRAQAGLRGPKSVSKNISPQNGGVAVHYGGPRQPAADSSADHARCISTWKAWQTYHMNTHGWSDIAYTGGFCQHGYAFAGRGAGVRTAANGTNAGNQNYYAVTWIGGEGQTPTSQALDAADWWIDQLRRAGANTAVKPHRFFKSTGCPGNPLVGYAGSRDRQHITVGGTSPTPAPAPAPASKPAAPKSTGDTLVFPTLKRGSTGQDVRNLQALLLAAGRSVRIDGEFGPGTETKLREYQKAAGLTVDGQAGTATFRYLLGV